MLDGGATERIGAEIRRIERDVEGSQVLVVTVAEAGGDRALQLLRDRVQGSRERRPGVCGARRPARRNRGWPLAGESLLQLVVHVDASGGCDPRVQGRALR